jgi:hypothetical protein
VDGRERRTVAIDGRIGALTLDRNPGDAFL